jgi:hypothetical protein
MPMGYKKNARKKIASNIKKCREYTVHIFLGYLKV